KGIPAIRSRSDRDLLGETGSGQREVHRQPVGGERGRPGVAARRVGVPEQLRSPERTGTRRAIRSAAVHCDFVLVAHPVDAGRRLADLSRADLARAVAREVAAAQRLAGGADSAAAVHAALALVAYRI